MSFTKVLLSDTLGGQIINLCKLYGLHKVTGDRFVVFRTTKIPSYWVDKPMQDICNTLDFVEYGGHMPHLWDEYFKIVNVDNPVSIEERAAFNNKYGFKFSGSKRDYILEAYPEYTGAYCFLPTKIEPVEDNEDAVIIQPWSGKLLESGVHGFNRFFHIDAIDRMCSALTSAGHKTIIIGRKNKWLYEDNAFDKLENKYNVLNMVDKTESIIEAMRYVCGAGYMIGFDGIFTFFAGTQRVSTINFSPLCPNTRIQFSNDTCESWLEHMISIEGMPAGVPINFPTETFVKLFTMLKKGVTGVWAVGTVNKGNM